MLRVDDFLSSLSLLVCRSSGLFSGCNTSFLVGTRILAVKVFPKRSAGCDRICYASIPAHGCFSARMELGNDTDCIELILEWSLVKRVPVDLGDFPTHVRS
jgi:hypothetical protein